MFGVAVLGVCRICVSRCLSFYVVVAVIKRREAQEVVRTKHDAQAEDECAQVRRVEKEQTVEAQRSKTGVCTPGESEPRNLYLLHI